MIRSFGFVAPVLLTLGFVAYACTPGEVVQGPVTGSAGSSSTGTGNTGMGSAGTMGNGGTTGTGATGVAGRGGTVGTAGTTGGGARGGTTGTGATIGTAGTTGGGARGGTTGTGATVGTAGTTGTGSAGTLGTSCPAAFDVQSDGFARAPAVGGGCWHGYAFAGGDAGSTITPANFMACGMPCSLHMMGTVGAATAANNYVGVAYLGFNVAQDNGSMTKGTIAPTGSSVTVTFTASTGGLPLRAQLSSGSTFWCYTITGTGSVTIPYPMFNTACWDGSGTAYAKAAIDNFELVVPGGATATSGVNVTLTSVKENP